MEAPMIYKTITDVMGKVNAISKGRRNNAQNFQFRGIDDVMNELHPIMAECGLFVVPTVLEENRTTGKTSKGGDMFYTRLKINFAFYAQDGSHVDSVVIGEAMDTGDKASNKALSIGLKYALLQVFCIPTEDDKDPDASSHEFMSQAAQQERSRTKQQEAQKQAAPQLPGGPDTPEQHALICELFGAKDQKGNRLFTQDEIDMYTAMRSQAKTADQLIEFLKKK